MKEIVTGVVFTLVMLSCSPVKHGIVGHYKSKTYNRLQHMYYQVHNSTYVLHSTLDINADSTFVKMTCGNAITGNWRVKADTLMLICKRFTYHNDSLNKIRDTICGSDPDKYFIHSSGELRQTYFIKELKMIGRDYLVREDR
jgi:hypothetical protein